MVFLPGWNYMTPIQRVLECATRGRYVGTYGVHAGLLLLNTKAVQISQTLC